MDHLHKFIVSNKHRFVYYEIQKCATGTMREYFISEGNPYEVRRIVGDASDIEKYYVEAGYFQFTFVRNPWERVVSAWLDKFVFYHDPRNPGLPGIRGTRLNLQTTFIEFVKFIARTPDKRADCHFKSQHQFIPTDNIFIGRVERLQRDFNIIRTNIGIPLKEIPHKHKTSDKVEKHWKTIYNETTKIIVAGRYAKDIELYGYTFR